VRRFSQNWQTGHLRMMFHNVTRRREWFTENASPRQYANLLLAAAEFGLKHEVMRAWPVLAKVDISPLCNLSCTYCVHARSVEPSNPILQSQSFHGHQRMPLEQFARIVDELAGKTLAVSLYYLGDPLVHPDLARMCQIVADSGLNSHISSNFSFNLSDARLESLVRSGLTHLTVCVDAMRQESYERTRVGGRLHVVLHNLERLLSIRRELGQVYPKVEVQYIKFQHNVDQLEEAARWCNERGVDRFTDYWGNLHNYTDLQPGNYQVFGPKANKPLPQCAWPHFALQIKYNGDVIPCCYYRHGDQYRDGADSRAIGNVFDTSVWEVWNDDPYQQLRRLVSNPTRATTHTALAETFCTGCPTIYQTNAEEHRRIADVHHWEERYQRDEHNRVVRH